MWEGQKMPALSRRKALLAQTAVRNRRHQIQSKKNNPKFTKGKMEFVTDRKKNGRLPWASRGKMGKHNTFPTLTGSQYAEKKKNALLLKAPP